jgi:hypothetical protein
MPAITKISKKFFCYHYWQKRLIQYPFRFGISFGYFGSSVFLTGNLSAPLKLCVSQGATACTEITILAVLSFQ